MCGKLRNRHCK